MVEERGWAWRAGNERWPDRPESIPDLETLLVLALDIFFSVQKILFFDLPEQYIDTFLSPPFDIVV